MLQHHQLQSEVLAAAIKNSLFSTAIPIDGSHFCHSVHVIGQVINEVFIILIKLETYDANLALTKWLKKIMNKLAFQNLTGLK